jgi:flagellar hook-associated protein 1 FlgK
MSISSLLYTSRDSLLAHQLAIDITGSNIANVDTPGYSRQRVDLKSVGNVSVVGNSAQIGVSVSRIERSYDSHLDSQISDQQQNQGYSDARLQGLQNIEVMLDDTAGGGINNQLNQFWASWQNLAKNPSGRVERSALVSSAESLTDSFATYRQSLYTINTDLNRSITDAVSQVNDKIAEITDLNARIMGTGSDRGDKNDLLDKRSLAIKELSGLVDITSFEGSNGSFNVFLSNGEPLLQGTLGQILSVRRNANGNSEIYTSSRPQETVNDAVSKGKLGAYIELQSRIVPEYTAAIDDVAHSLANRVNELHNTGFDAYQNMGSDFFVIGNAANVAGTLQVNSAIVDDANRIAASASVMGDSDIASQIAAVQDELLLNNNSATLNSGLASIVGEIGHQVSSAKTDNAHQSIITNQLNNQRESLSGVSLDEEMIRLIRYQMGYTAAGKLITTVDEMLDTLMGIVK